ncbi:collagen alpha-1(I) chain-like isoform X3 [Chiroxiphia lanceolata]|uniref:collagen alpha-1(I) chain-like isoform X3 n=1 Tax=Chiroxiphia lanceolata TaxID=296741 RepID=UPI0013CEF4AD|nr:collagen alpha-1(I) chain-like isoform X3 [Chiroxiphia lanceolata]
MAETGKDNVPWIPRCWGGSFLEPPQSKALSRVGLSLFPVGRAEANPCSSGNEGELGRLRWGFPAPPVPAGTGEKGLEPPLDVPGWNCVRSCPSGRAGEQQIPGSASPSLLQTWSLHGSPGLCVAEGDLELLSLPFQEPDPAGKGHGSGIWQHTQILLLPKETSEPRAQMGLGVEGGPGPSASSRGIQDSWPYPEGSGICSPIQGRSGTLSLIQGCSKTFGLTQGDPGPSASPGPDPVQDQEPHPAAPPCDAFGVPSHRAGTVEPLPSRSWELCPVPGALGCFGAAASLVPGVETLYFLPKTLIFAAI